MNERNTNWASVSKNDNHRSSPTAVQVMFPIESPQSHFRVLLDLNKLMWLEYALRKSPGRQRRYKLVPGSKFCS